MTFEQIWLNFSWIIDEMKDGMCFFEGYIPSVETEDLQPRLSELINNSQSWSSLYSVWSNNTTKSDWERKYTISEYLEFFRAGKIILLHFDYERKTEGLSIHQKLIFEKCGEILTLEIICYREAILESAYPKDALEKSISELRYIKKLFNGDSLFIGPDTLNYPKNKDDNPKEWLRIE